MKPMETIDIEALIERTGAEGKGRAVVWQDSESIAFLSRGRKRRMDFHVDPSDEVTLVLKGEQRLHCLTHDGNEKVVIMGPGQMTLCPGGVPHSPRVDRRHLVPGVRAGTQARRAGSVHVVLRELQQESIRGGRQGGRLQR